MATFVIYGITCQDNQESEDEVYLQARADAGPWQEVWASDMNKGDSKLITWHSDYTNRIRIRLMESDGMARAAGFIASGDDELGYFELPVPHNDTGMMEQVLTPSVDGRSSTYKISYEIVKTLGEAAISDWITFTRIKCNDAKGIKDKVYLTFNNHPFWGPLKMKTGDERPIINRTVYISGQCKLQLWESDSVGNNDDLGSAIITAQSYGAANSDGEYNIEFHWRVSRTRDSRYTLFFRQAPPQVID
jgi:hypothetical protein